MSSHTVRPGQIYRRADDPREMWVKIRVLAVETEAGRAWVEDKLGGYARTVRLAALHADAITRTGTQRRTGYVLVDEEPGEP